MGKAAAIDLAAIGLIVYSYFEITNSLPPMPAQGSARLAITAAVWVSLGVEIFLTGLLLTVPWIGRVWPEVVHLGWRGLAEYTPGQRERIMPLVHQMMGMLSVTFNLFWGVNIHQHIRAGHSDPRRGPADLWWIGALLVSLAVITWYYVDKFDEAAGEE
jgi:hypothetical protein